MNKFIALKNKEIPFGGEPNHDALFQNFKIYESFPVPKCQESIGELRRKYNRNDLSITKELVLADALTTYSTLMLEKNWITEDPKAIAFASFISRAEQALYQSKNNDSSIKPTNRGRNNQNRYPNEEWKYKLTREDGPTTKKVKNELVKTKTYHWCDKLHATGKPMWALYKPIKHAHVYKPIKHAHVYKPTTAKENVSFYNPSLLWSTIITFLTYLL